MVETRRSLAAFAAPISAFRTGAPPITRPRPAAAKPWSARARLGFVLSSAILAWAAVIVAGIEVVRLIEPFAR